MTVVLPKLGTSPGLVTNFYAYPVGEPGEAATANFDYVNGWGPFGSLHQWNTLPSGQSRYLVDSDTITGGAGNNTIFGELGNNTITGGAGNDNISGGDAASTLGGGGGTNNIVYNPIDTYVIGGGNNIAVSSLNTAAGSSLLQFGWESVVGVELANVIIGAYDIIQTDGSTVLAQVNGNYYLYEAGGPVLAELSNGTTPITTNGFNGFIPIGAVRTSTGYDVALEDAGTGEFMIWSTNVAGKYTATILSAVPAANFALELIEKTFGQDLNGDSVIGLNPTIIQTDNGTSLDQIGNNYFLYAAGTTTGPELRKGGVPVIAGQLSGYTLVAAVKTASGYDVAWEDTTTDTFTVWSVNSSGAYTGTLFTGAPAISYTVELIRRRSARI